MLRRCRGLCDSSLAHSRGGCLVTATLSRQRHLGSSARTLVRSIGDGPRSSVSATPGPGAICPASPRGNRRRAARWDAGVHDSRGRPRENVAAPGPASDVYALGATLHSIPVRAAGPVEGRTVAETLDNVRSAFAGDPGGGPQPVRLGPAAGDRPRSSPPTVTARPGLGPRTWSAGWPRRAVPAFSAILPWRRAATVARKRPGWSPRPRGGLSGERRSSLAGVAVLAKM